MGLRAPLRLALLIAVTPPLYLGWVFTRPLAWAFPRTDRGLQRLWIGSWARTSLWIMGVQATYEGPIPEGRYFLVANHLSYVDIPLLLARLDARFLAKSEIAKWPVMGMLARTTGTLFVDRSRKRDLTRVLGEVKGVLDRGPGVIVFPEGTSTDGGAVERFKPSLFEVPVEVDVPVHCAALHYHAPAGPLPAWQAVCWWGDAPFGPHFFQFLKQERTKATVTFCAEIPPRPERSGPSRRKDLCQAAQALVERSFTPSRPLPGEPDRSESENGSEGQPSGSPCRPGGQPAQGADSPSHSHSPSPQPSPAAANSTPSGSAPAPLHHPDSTPSTSP